MAINRYNIRHWWLMLTGKSADHVDQNLGKSFKPGELAGYFNDLTNKVTIQKEILETDAVPLVRGMNGKDIEFPTAIFQYGLGAYDMYLQTGEDVYKKKFMNCVDWTEAHLEEKGGWNNFFVLYPKTPYGSMCQGEGASLLLRAYKLIGDNKYISLAKKALDFMLVPLEEGGTARYEGEDLFLHEFQPRAVVLNGWIFSVFGLYDMIQVCDDEKYRDAYEKTIATLKKELPKYDNGYWTIYDMEKRIASPFYHNLHIAQAEALFLATGDTIYDEYAKRWKKFQKSKIKYMRAFVKKAMQKVTEKF